MNALLSQDEIDGLFDDEPAVYTLTGVTHVPTLKPGVYQTGYETTANMNYAPGVSQTEISTLTVPGIHTTARYLSATVPTDALLHGVGDTMVGAPIFSDVFVIDEAAPLLSRDLVASLGLEGYYGDIAPLQAPGPGRVIDGGDVTFTVNTFSWPKAAPLAGDLDDEEEFFLDESPDGFSWCLIPDAKRTAWNAFCAGFEATAFDDPDDPPSAHLPDWVKVIEGHPRWTVFKRPRQKFS
ncbi:hypothetical protein CcrC1_gp090 [Caulobacter phage C1]|nr:hypothetical protein CcrC1_gp090 [Caulobacter phage C1]UTU08318.1 hypothetical protein CcrC2_gp090 [Caulobacter phage C2]UTU08839.1 hypothetical protein CcrJ4_gp088 [Caulobacter phage J4]UTU09392.1 hypothetical protein CcrBL47_gp106 [Caulobacter phage BL47]UTU09952.1 hypothetical protein CcrRB23_gp090 [Caulobacter phage RB23]WGN96977.1 hypothetical protein [Bertelyvirus sp.]